MIGTNDIETVILDEMGKQIFFLISEIQKVFPNTLLAIIGIYPRLTNSSNFTYYSLREKQIKYNQKLKELTIKKSNTKYYYFGNQIQKDQSKEIDEIDKKRYLVDNVHLSYEGYQTLSNGILKIIIENIL